MYELIKKGDDAFPYIITDENGSVVARVRGEQDAKEIVAALNFVQAVGERFPGIVNGQDEVDGSDFVEFIGFYIRFREDGRFESAEH